MITFIPTALLLVDKGEHLILVLVLKESLKCKEISAADCLKPPISMLLTSVFYVFLPDLALRYKKPVYSSSLGSVEEH